MDEHHHGVDMAEQGRAALTGHAAHCAASARARYGTVDYPALLRILEDRTVVRYPTELAFDATELLPGEFAHAVPSGNHPAEGYRLCVHPHFENRPQDLPLLIAYHLVRINYGQVATPLDAEVFASSLLGMDQEDYYQRICALADELVDLATASNI